jgi:hypothetical protein
VLALLGLGGSGLDLDEELRIGERGDPDDAC